MTQRAGLDLLQEFTNPFSEYDVAYRGELRLTNYEHMLIMMSG
jgi:hypothetical protein